MNNQELIEELKKLPPLQPVMVRDRNGWFAELAEVRFEGNHTRLENSDG